MKTEQFNEYVIKFGDWLKEVKKQKKNTVSSRLANIRTVGKHYDILKEYLVDECQDVLSNLSFSTKDVEPKTDIIIEGNYYNGLSTYRQVVKLFVEFLKDVHYAAPVVDDSKVARFIGSFDDFKRYIGPKCRNNVNIFCKSERSKHKGICEWCGEVDELQSAHVKERPVIMKEILDSYYRVSENWYDVNIDEFLTKFKDAHMPVEDHIFFLCKKCHDMLDKHKTITAADVFAKRKTF